MQLDLARQKETVETIADVIRFSAGAGYNALLLYLEAVVRTPSFDELPETMSYSADEVRQIVDLGQQAGLDVFPCIATLAHAEHFFLVERLKPLAEVVEDQPPQMFCPSEPRTYEFLESYLFEVAALFPSRNFHVGLDEAWHLGKCPTCRARTDKDGHFLGLLIDHLLRIHEIVTTRLGKRTWIWDDLFEYASLDMLAKVPRDVVMCTWNYDPQAVHRAAGVQAHFNQHRRTNWLAGYQQLGFDVMVCPRANGIRNVVEMTEYGRRYPVAGGIMTTWELANEFLPGQMPAIALGGMLWSDPGLDESDAIDRMIEQLFGTNLHPNERVAIEAALTEPLWSSLDPQGLLRGAVSMEEHRSLQAWRVFENLLGDLVGRNGWTVRQRQVLEELAIRASFQRIVGELRPALQDLVDPASAARDRAAATIRDLAKHVRDLAEHRARQWAEQRPGVTPDRASIHLSSAADRLEQFADQWSVQAGASGLIELDLFLWDNFSAPRLRVEVLDAAGKPSIVAEGIFKPFNNRQSQYTVQVPIRVLAETAGLDTIRLVVSGFGGQGVRFVRVLLTEGYLEPAGIAAASGEVFDAQAALVDDSSVCYLGSASTAATLFAHAERAESSLTLSLRPARSRR